MALTLDQDKYQDKFSFTSLHDEKSNKMKPTYRLLQESLRTMFKIKEKVTF